MIRVSDHRRDVSEYLHVVSNSVESGFSFFLVKENSTFSHGRNMDHPSANCATRSHRKYLDYPYDELISRRYQSVFLLHRETGANSRFVDKIEVGRW